MARWQHSVAEMDQVAFYKGNATYVDFFPLLAEAMELNKNFVATSGIDATFAERFTTYRRNQLMYAGTNFLYTLRAVHPKEEDMPGFYADFSLNALDNSLLEYPEGIRLMGLLKTSSDLALSKTLGARPTTAVLLENNLGALSTDALKGEMILLSAKALKTYDEMQVLKTQFLEEIKRTGIEARFDELMLSKASLAKGETAIPFVFEDASGKAYSLSYFEGKTVYIDVWATWCAPCRKELPYLKELHEKFKKNKNLVFVSISTDAVKDYEKWKKMRNCMKSLRRIRTLYL
ncbi:Redoxin [Popillia japonica]|uniref:Peroxiredoxin-5, mitochondrial n=1 Tax=Popillia japonica TaxID=7064 RepID=A0AAW1H371_POPJA